MTPPPPPASTLASANTGARARAGVPRRSSGSVPAAFQSAVTGRVYGRASTGARSAAPYAATRLGARSADPARFGAGVGVDAVSAFLPARRRSCRRGDGGSDAPAARHARWRAPPRAVLSTGTAQDKREALLERVRGLDLGRRVAGKGAAQRDIDENYIKPLEALNPTPTPIESPLLDGTWELVYTDSRNILGLDRPAPARPRAGSVLQIIRVSEGEVVNAERVLNFVTNRVRATFTTDAPRRVNVSFQRFQFGWLSVPAPRSARGFLDVTYLDEHVRISRGNKDSVFVLVRQR